jgi:phage gp46-like protein
MNEARPFEGDLLLFSTADGGEIPVEDGQFSGDRSFNTAVYLSLFGGNSGDSGKVKNNKTWWGNLLPGAAEHEKMVSRFQAFITAKPMTTKNIQEAIKAAELDLRWIIDEGIAGAVTVTGAAGSGSRFNLRVSVEAAGASMYENTFSLFWKVGVYGGV